MPVVLDPVPKKIDEIVDRALRSAPRIDSPYFRGPDPGETAPVIEGSDLDPPAVDNDRKPNLDK